MTPLEWLLRFAAGVLIGMIAALLVTMLVFWLVEGATAVARYLRTRRHHA